MYWDWVEREFTLDAAQKGAESMWGSEVKHKGQIGEMIYMSSADKNFVI